MPNGGPTPDCIHCKLFQGTYDSPWHCTLHNIKLATPIRAFCSGYVDPEPNEKGDWLDQKLNRAELDANWMYVWMDWSEEENWSAKGITSTFEYLPLVPISEYNQWTFEMVLDACFRIAEQKRGGKGS